MNRRFFLRTSGLAGISFTTLAVGSCQPKAPLKDLPNETPADSFELMEYTIADLQRAMENANTVQPLSLNCTWTGLK